MCTEKILIDLSLFQRPDYKQIFGDRLRKIRKIKKLTQKQVAEAIGMSTSGMTQIENGQKMPSTENLFAISSALNVPVALLAHPLKMSDKHIRLIIKAMDLIILNPNSVYLETIDQILAVALKK